eukprot:COSAG06_NODE_59674_length_273_cov_0.890805_1_plen_55_part_10
MMQGLQREGTVSNHSSILGRDNDLHAAYEARVGERDRAALLVPLRRHALDLKPPQ